MTASAGRLRSGAPDVSVIWDSTSITIFMTFQLKIEIILHKFTTIVSICVQIHLLIFFDLLVIVLHKKMSNLPLEEQIARIYNNLIKERNHIEVFEVLITDPCELTTVISAVAIAIAKSVPDNDELEIWSLAFIQLATTLDTIKAQRILLAKIEQGNLDQTNIGDEKILTPSILI